jgi:glycosyltransferase involved in cell wall biosynthesis
VTAPAPAGHPRVALVSVGLGRVQRGFERTFSDVFDAVRGAVDVTVFKSGGRRTTDEKVPRFLKPVTFVARILPLGRFGGDMEYHRDCIAFGIVLLPYLLLGKFDIVHTIDPPMAKVLGVLKRVFRLRAIHLYTEGCAMPPEYYPRADHVHQVGDAARQDAVAHGIPESDMTLVPIGVRPASYTTTAGRDELRRKHGVPDDTFVILAVSAVNRHHKRIDHLIDEVNGLDGDVLLWIDGNPEDPTLVEHARAKLGDRCRIAHGPSHEIPELYRLADVMVQTSVIEAFGIAIVEALCSGVFVLTHDARHFQWLVREPECMLDMTAPGALTARLRELMTHRERLTAGAAERARRARERYDWSHLGPRYVAMYRGLV